MPGGARPVLKKGRQVRWGRNAPVRDQPRPRQTRHPFAAGLIPESLHGAAHPAAGSECRTTVALRLPARCWARCAESETPTMGSCPLAASWCWSGRPRTLRSFTGLHSRSNSQCCPGFRGIKPGVSGAPVTACRAPGTPFLFHALVHHRPCSHGAGAPSHQCLCLD